MGPVVVTGAAGFIGRHVVRHLIGEGTTVIAVDRRPPAGDGDSLPRHGVRQLTIELTDGGAELAGALRSAQAVIHLAGCPGVRSTAPGIEARRELDNVAATRVVLALTPLHVPVVVASSSSVYGGARDGRPSAEDDRLRPRGGYALSKVRAERECAIRARRGGAVTVVRPFSVGGPGQRADMALSRWIEQARRGEPLTVFGSLRRTRDVTDVRDVAVAIGRLARLAPRTVVNLGSGHPVTLGELVGAVHEQVAPTGVRLLPATAEEPDDTWADTRRCRALLGFTPGAEVSSLVAAMLAASPLVGEALPA